MTLGLYEQQFPSLPSCNSCRGLGLVVGERGIWITCPECLDPQPSEPVR